MHHSVQHKVLLLSLKTCQERADLPVLLHGLCLHVVYFLGLGSKLHET